MKTRMFLLLTALLYAGCAAGPNYRRPRIETPSTFRAPEPLPPQQTVSVADLKWFEVFNDPQLQDLVRTAVQRNYDLRDAIARVEEARANLGIARSNQYPNFGAGATLEVNRLSRDGATPSVRNGNQRYPRDGSEGRRVCTPLSRHRTSGSLDRPSLCDQRPEGAKPRRSAFPHGRNPSNEARRGLDPRARVGPYRVHSSPGRQ